MSLFDYIQAAFKISSWLVLGIVFLLFLGWLFRRGIRDPEFRRLAPNLMTSLGIFGTFLGIFFALYPLDFSPGKINDSVESLLAGMKLAFLTSLLGLGASIAFRIYEATSLKTSQAVSPEQGQVLSRLDAIRHAIAGEEDSSIASKIQQLHQANAEGFQKLDDLRDMPERLDAIKHAISGEEDSSLASQIEQLRIESTEGFQKLDGLNDTIRNVLLENLQNLINELRDIIGNQLGESLRNLIANIEKALIEQFGKTFVEFNQATQAIRQWQEKHMQHVEELTRAFEMTSRRIEQIATHCERIPETMAQLNEIMEIEQSNVAQLNKQVEAFAGMRQQAQDAFPTIKEHLDKIGQDLAQSAQGFERLEGTIRSTLESAEHETRRVAQQHTENVQAMAAGMVETMNNSQHDASEKMAVIINEAINNLQQQTERLAREYGDNMVSIAQACAERIQDGGRI